MATILAFPGPRSLKEIAFDLSSVKGRLAVHYARTGDPSDEEDREWSSLEQQKERLEADFVSTFQSVTGLRWSDAESVMS